LRLLFKVREYYTEYMNRISRLLNIICSETMIFPAVFVLLCLFTYIQFIAGYAGDKGWLLLNSQEWLAGKKLYVDLFEPNMPLITWHVITSSLATHFFRLMRWSPLFYAGIFLTGVKIGNGCRTGYLR